MKEKFYIGKLYGVKWDTIPSRQELFFLASLFFGEDQNRECIGTFIFSKTMGGYKEVKTGRVFSFYEDRSLLGMPPKIPTTRLFLDKDDIRKLAPEKFDTWYREYDNKLSVEELNRLFDAEEAKQISAVSQGTGPKK